MCFKRKEPLHSKCKPLKLGDTFTYLASNISSAKSDVNIHLANAWTAIDRLAFIKKSDLSDKIKWNFFQPVVVSILLYRYTKWTHGDNLYRNCTKMLRAV